MTYPAIEQAVAEIAYDNGAINVNRSEGYVLTHVMAALDNDFTDAELTAVNAELDALDDETFEELTCGDSDSIEVSDVTRRVLAAAFEGLPA